MASRTIGSPQIRNRGTVGGNLGSASPAGDAHPALLAAEAVVELASVEGTRMVRAEDFYLGVKRHAGRRDELVTAVHLTAPTGPQQFSKIGTRNAMVISVAAFSLALHPDRRMVRTGLGSVAPTPRRRLRRRGVPDRRAGRRRAVGLPRRRCPRGWPGSSATGSATRRPPSTTSAVRRPTGCTRSRCWRGGH